jgi:hypothetical protein
MSWRGQTHVASVMQVYIVQEEPEDLEIRNLRPFRSSMAEKIM